MFNRNFTEHTELSCRYCKNRHKRDRDQRLEGFCLREAAKKRYFLVARPLRPYPLPPRALWPQKFFQNFFQSFKNRPFFLVAKPLPPPPLSGRAIKKIPIFCGFSKQEHEDHELNVPVSIAARHYTPPYVPVIIHLITITKLIQISFYFIQNNIYQYQYIHKGLIMVKYFQITELIQKL